MKLEILKIIELDTNSTFICLGVGKNFGFSFDWGWAFHFGIVIKGVVFSVWKYYTGDKWTRLCFTLGKKRFAVRIP